MEEQEATDKPLGWLVVIRQTDGLRRIYPIRTSTVVDLDLRTRIQGRMSRWQQPYVFMERRTRQGLHWLRLDYALTPDPTTFDDYLVKFFSTEDAAHAYAPASVPRQSSS